VNCIGDKPGQVVIPAPDEATVNLAAGAFIEFMVSLGRCAKAVPGAIGTLSCPRGMVPVPAFTWMSRGSIPCRDSCKRYNADLKASRMRFLLWVCAAFLGTVVVRVIAVFWRNRRSRMIRMEMKRHLQRIGTLRPYDPTNS